MRDFITIEESKDIRLSDNFTLYEFLRSDVAIRNGIDNKLPRNFLPHIEFLVKTILQPVRDKFGPIRILSGYRNDELSIKVGSSTRSNHCFGLAADIEPYDNSIQLIDIINFINTLKYKELIGEFLPHGWVHVAAQEGFNKQVLKLKDPTHHYTRLSIEEMNNIYKENVTV